jgi:hypothetical protein
MDSNQEKALKMAFIIYNFRFFIGGAVTFTLGPCCSLLRRIPDKNDRCAFTRGSRGGVMITQSESNSATYKKTEVRNSRGFTIRYLVFSLVIVFLSIRNSGK